MGESFLLILVWILRLDNLGLQKIKGYLYPEYLPSAKVYGSQKWDVESIQPTLGRVTAK